VQADLEQAIEHYYETIAEVLKGNSEPQKELWSRGDDVLLANPLGPPARGWSDVETAFDRAAGVMTDGQLLGHERITEHETPELAYIFEIERGRARFGGSEEHATVSLRTTTIWRREEDAWKIVLRQADPITTPRPVESMFER
jgi:ketosteroid isomerase-like protein